MFYSRNTCRGRIKVRIGIICTINEGTKKGRSDVIMEIVIKLAGVS